jgi:hypothetical protein
MNIAAKNRIKVKPHVLLKPVTYNEDIISPTIETTMNEPFNGTTFFNILITSLVLFWLNNYLNVVNL